jgi:hypothetical protein
MENRNEYHRLYREKNKDKVLEIERDSDKRNAENRAFGRIKSIFKIFEKDKATDKEWKRTTKNWSNIKTHLKNVRLK